MKVSWSTTFIYKSLPVQSCTHCTHFLNTEIFCLHFRSSNNLKRQKKKVSLTNIHLVAKLLVHHMVESDIHKSMWRVCDRKSEHIQKMTKHGNAIHSVLPLSDILKQVLSFGKGKAKPANILISNELLWNPKKLFFLSIQSIKLSPHYLVLEQCHSGGILCGFLVWHIVLKFWFHRQPPYSLLVSFKGVSNWASVNAILEVNLGTW